MIPDFDHNNVIPPHIGNPTLQEHLSPYNCSTLELCQSLGRTKERVLILKGLLEFRQKMTNLGIIEGFQWIDGSFTENIEKSERRHPNDLDIVTFFKGLKGDKIKEIKTNFVEFIDPNMAKSNYNLDHYLVDYSFDPDVTVEMTRYWIQLFSHNRLGVWKGILRLELNTVDTDKQALDYLNSIEI
ncbi:DUF6932 family protein [Tenacibaculum discolor]|uniref:DUF6932 family protein n=1 Tax=Tenacibaculum discolor TaxID=361581 RepID=UPI000EB022A6|nr:hypothetical protein [Tenacibaculum discolor]RLK03090.1 hypothetical protein C8N27_0938 [Tenacibaculum discolor]